jgi:hypothetical protein
MYAYVTDTPWEKEAYIFNAALKAEFSADVYCAEKIVKRMFTETEKP